MKNEIKLTHEQKIQQKDLIQRLLQSEVIVGTKCRYGIEYTLPYKQKPTVSLRKHWDLSHEELITGYSLEGELNGKLISFYEGNAHNKFFELIFEHVAKKCVQKHEEKIEKEKQNLERMIKEDSEKTLTNKLRIKVDEWESGKKENYFGIPIKYPEGKKFDIYIATLKNIRFKKGMGETGYGLGFKIMGDVELSKKEQTETTIEIKSKKIRKTKEKNIWTTSNYNLSCTFYEQRSGVIGVVPYGKPLWIDHGKDSNWYVTKIQEHLQRHKIELSENTLKELFNPIFEKLHFSDMIRIYTGNKK